MVSGSRSRVTNNFAGCWFEEEIFLGHDSLYRQFSARSPLNSSSELSKIQYYDLKIDPGRERTALQQAGFQIVTLIVTLVIAIIGGLVTGELPSYLSYYIYIYYVYNSLKSDNCGFISCWLWMPFGANSGTILSLSFFRQPYEENDSQPDQLTLVVDQLLLSERRLNVINATN